jgi:hypothetical protein
MAADLVSIQGLPKVGEDIVESVLTQATSLGAPFYWFKRDYSEKFASNFLTTLIGDPLILCILAHIATHAKIGSLFTSIQGFPGSGKTHVLVLVAAVLAVSVEANVLWTTKGDEALKSAAQCLIASAMSRRLDS